MAFDIDKWIEREEPDGEWYPTEDSGVKCHGNPPHIIKEGDDTDIFTHNGLTYCDDCFKELGVYPSDIYWDLDNRENWDVEDDGVYLGEDE